MSKQVHIQVSRDGVTISAPITHGVIADETRGGRRVTMRMGHRSALKLADGLRQLLGHYLEDSPPELEHTIIGAPYVDGGNR